MNVKAWQYTDKCITSMDVTEYKYTDISTNVTNKGIHILYANFVDNGRMRNISPFLLLNDFHCQSICQETGTTAMEVAFFF